MPARRYEAHLDRKDRSHRLPVPPHRCGRRPCAPSASLRRRRPGQERPPATRPFCNLHRTIRHGAPPAPPRRQSAWVWRSFAMSQLRIEPAPPQNGIQRVAVSGRLDTRSYPELDQALDPLLDDERVSSLVLDLEGLNYISSAGIRSLYRARRTLAARRRRVLLVNPQPQVQKVFDVVKSVPLKDVFTSVEEADEYLDAVQRKLVAKVATTAS